MSSPHQPKPMLQPLTSMLRMQHVMPIRSCSKAPGVFSSNYRYPASSPEVHFHRASPRDSSPVITLFVHVGIYPTRNCAHVFLDMDHFFISFESAAYGLFVPRFGQIHLLLNGKVAFLRNYQIPTIVLVLLEITEVTSSTLGRL